MTQIVTAPAKIWHRWNRAPPRRPRYRI